MSPEQQNRILQGDALLTGVVASIIATLIITAITWGRENYLFLPNWLMIILGFVIFFSLTILARYKIKQIKQRYLCFRVLSEVSVSKCGDLFIELLRKTLKESPKRDEHALTQLKKIQDIRKHPTWQVYQRVVALPQNQETLLETYTTQKGAAFNRAIQQLAEFLKEQLLSTADVHIVLYGYSLTVCEALTLLSKDLVCRYPIFIVEDLQYGIEGSHREHRMAKEHLEKKGLHPLILPFTEITKLCSNSAHFAQSSSGRLIPLPAKRRVLVLIGCEAVDIDGNALIPSRVVGIPSETAKFIEVSSYVRINPDTGLTNPDTGLMEIKIIIASESYKTYVRLDRFTSTHAPLKISLFQRLLYVLSGRLDTFKITPVELVPIETKNIYAIVDDIDAHLNNQKRIDLVESYLGWEKRIDLHLDREGRIRDFSNTKVPYSHKIANLIKSSEMLIFNMDGVLMDTEREHFLAFAYVVAKAQRLLSHLQYRNNCKGISTEDGIKNLIKNNIVNGKANLLFEEKLKRFKERIGKISAPCFPHAKDLVQKAYDSGKTLYLVTASTQDEVEMLLEACGMTEMFHKDRIHAGMKSEEGHDLYENLYEKIKNETKEQNIDRCLLLDDSVKNLESAKKRGIKTIGFSTDQTLKAEHADFIVDNPKALLTIWKQGEE